MPEPLACATLPKVGQGLYRLLLERRDGHYVGFFNRRVGSTGRGLDVNEAGDILVAEPGNHCSLLMNKEQAQADENEEVSSTPKGKRAARGHRGRELRQNPGRARP